MIKQPVKKTVSPGLELKGMHGDMEKTPTHLTQPTHPTQPKTRSNRQMKVLGDKVLGDMPERKDAQEAKEKDANERSNRQMMFQDPVTDLTEDTLWEAVLNRDSRYDGIVYFAVATTGIYCRFHCSARRPLRENVRFFMCREGAEKAGFRACLRCHPESAKKRFMDVTVSKVVAVCRYIENKDYVPSLDELAEQVGLSTFHLQRIFKKSLGVSPRNYADAHRQCRLKKALKEGEDIAGATYEAGYGSSSRIYERSNDYLGMTPKAYREKGKGYVIYYSVVKACLGHLLLAATEKGVCAIRIGDCQNDLIDELNSEFQNADIREADDRLNNWTQQVIDYISCGSKWPGFPYDVKATAFQRRVWDFIRTIPEGETMSYSDVAASIGKPKAARAVANACAANSVAIIVPCHRVVPRAGGVGGYKWGKERKKKLLQTERNRKRN